jgi:hypothetical protein
MRAWAADPTRRRAAWFLEDDLEVSPLVFRWLAWCLDYADAVVQQGDQGGILMGCAGHTPRVDELTPTPGTSVPLSWTPEDVLGAAPHWPVFRMQVPCSWGTLWLPRPWATFRAYYAARASGAPPRVRPALKSDTWWDSWKRYLVEWMVAEDAHLVYSAFPAQASFVCNHYEVGVHHYGAHDTARPIPDALRTEPDPRFAVPLLTDARALAQALPTVQALRAHAAATHVRLADLLPLITWQHRLGTPSASPGVPSSCPAA